MAYFTSSPGMKGWKSLLNAILYRNEYLPLAVLIAANQL